MSKSLVYLTEICLFFFFLLRIAQVHVQLDERVWLRGWSVMSIEELSQVQGGPLQFASPAWPVSSTHRKLPAR